jgi:hypothetical protein
LSVGFLHIISLVEAKISIRESMMHEDTGVPFGSQVCGMAKIICQLHIEPIATVLSRREANLGLHPQW